MFRCALLKKKKRGYRVCSSGVCFFSCNGISTLVRLKKKKRGYRVCSSGYAATDTS
jgi:hypothetical protein